MMVLLFLVIFSGNSFSSETIVEGSIKLELRQFEDDENNETFESQSSLLGKINLEKEFDVSQFRLAISGRYDSQDSSRTHIWPEDIYFKTQVKADYRILAGYKIFNLSYMEAFNPLDILNARIFDVSVVNAEKIGELSIGIETQVNSGTLSFYFLPHPTRPQLPGPESRLNLPTELNDSVWLGSNDNEENWGDHFFLMYERSFENFDSQFVFHKGIDRTRVIIGTDNFIISGNTAIPRTLDFFTPYYYERYLSGASIVYNFDEFQFKSSLVHSYYLSNQDIYTLQGMKSPVDHTTAVIGFEKIRGHSNNWESTFIIEYQYQSLADEEFREDFALQNDLFLAWKLSFNDLNSKQVVLSFMRNMEGAEEGYAQISYSQRLFEDYKLEAGFLRYEVPTDANISSYGIYKNAKHAYLNWVIYM
jgi:hypothetical protein